MKEDTREEGMNNPENLSTEVEEKENHFIIKPECVTIIISHLLKSWQTQKEITHPYVANQT